MRILRGELIHFYFTYHHLSLFIILISTIYNSCNITLVLSFPVKKQICHYSSVQYVNTDFYPKITIKIIFDKNKMKLSSKLATLNAPNSKFQKIKITINFSSSGV